MKDIHKGPKMLGVANCFDGVREAILGKIVDESYQ